jgi:hypothetical protein
VTTEARLSQARTEQMLAESAELRARTIERLLGIEAEISNLKAQISKQAFPPAAPVPVAVAASAPPTEPAPVASAVVASAAPTLEMRVAQLEAQVLNLKSQISKFKTAPKRLRTTTRKPAARRK